MKTELTKEQSQHLIELGVPKEKASERIFCRDGCGYPIFTLSDLFVMLDSIRHIELYIRHWKSCWRDNWEIDLVEHVRLRDTRLCSNILIDGLYVQIIWCLENGCLKFDKSNLN